MSSTEKKHAIECHICSKVFYRHDVFRCHLRIHNNDKPYACDVCGKRFAHHGNRNQHAATHSNSLSYKCDFCDSAFSSKIYLNRHVKKKHPELYVPSKKGQVLPERRNSSVFFKQNFNNKKNQKADRISKEKTTLKCGLCERPYANQIALKRHAQKMHPEVYSLSQRGQMMPKQNNTKQSVKQNENDVEEQTTESSESSSEKSVTLQFSSKADTFSSHRPNGATRKRLSGDQQWAGTANRMTSGITHVPVSQSEININIAQKSGITSSAPDVSEEKIHSAGIDDSDSTVGSRMKTMEHEKVYIPPSLQITESTPCQVQGAKILTGLKCPYCEDVFEQRHKYQLHIMMHELEQRKTSMVCNQTFCTLQEKKKHDLSHSSNTNLTEKMYIPMENINSYNGLSKQNMPVLKGFSPEDMKVVGMIYTATGAGGQMNSQHSSPGLESFESQNSAVVKTEVLSDTDST